MADITWATKSLIADDVGSYETVRAALIDTNKVATIWREFDSPNEFLKSRVATISGNSFAWGDEDNIDPGVSYGLMVDLAKVATDRFVTVFGSEANDDDGTTRYVSVSGTTTTPENPVKFNSDDTKYPICCPLDTDKFVVIFSDVNDSNKGKAVVCTISGSTITPGSVQTFADDGFFRRSQAVQLDTDKFAFLSAEGGGSIGVWLYVATVSGTTITFGTPIKLFSGAVYATTYSLCKVDDNRLVAMYVSGANNDSYSARAISVDGTDAEAGDAATIYSGAVRPGAVCEGGTEQFIAVYPTTTGFFSRLCTVNWGSKEITVGDEETIDGTNADYGFVIKLESGKVAAFWGEVDGSFHDVNGIIGSYGESDFANTVEGGGSGDSPKIVKRPFWLGRRGVYDPKPYMKDVDDPKPSMKIVEDKGPKMVG